jgi:prevent-host-death family protein
MEASIRELKAHLSEYVRRAAEGEDVQVSVHGRVVAKIVPAAVPRDLASLRAEPGITWSGGKPVGVEDAETLAGGAVLAEWVTEDRR